MRLHWVEALTPETVLVLPEDESDDVGEGSERRCECGRHTFEEGDH